MVRQKTTKNPYAKAASLLAALLILILSFIHISDWSGIGIAEDCSMRMRLGYSFFHASPLHALINAWCLLSIVFLYDISLWRLLIAYIVAVSVPEITLSDVPTIGLSCICYFLLGSIVAQVKRKIFFIACIALYIAVGFFFPSVNAPIHLYGFIIGMIVGFLNAPLSSFRPPLK